MLFYILTVKIQSNNWILDLPELTLKKQIEGINHDFKKMLYLFPLKEKSNVIRFAISCSVRLAKDYGLKILLQLIIEKLEQKTDGVCINEILPLEFTRILDTELHDDWYSDSRNIICENDFEFQQTVEHYALMQHRQVDRLRISIIETLVDHQPSVNMPAMHYLLSGFQGKTLKDKTKVLAEQLLFSGYTVSGKIIRCKSFIGFPIVAISDAYGLAQGGMLVIDDLLSMMGCYSCYERYCRLNVKLWNEEYAKRLRNLIITNPSVTTIINISINNEKFIKRFKESVLSDTIKEIIKNSP